MHTGCQNQFSMSTCLQLLDGSVFHWNFQLLLVNYPDACIGYTCTSPELWPMTCENQFFSISMLSPTFKLISSRASGSRPSLMIKRLFFLDAQNFVGRFEGSFGGSLTGVCSLKQKYFSPSRCVREHTRLHTLASHTSRNCFVADHFGFLPFISNLHLQKMFVHRGVGKYPSRLRNTCEERWYPTPWFPAQLHPMTSVLLCLGSMASFLQWLHQLSHSFRGQHQHFLLRAWRLSKQCVKDTSTWCACVVPWARTQSNNEMARVSEMQPVQVLSCSCFFEIISFFVIYFCACPKQKQETIGLSSQVARWDEMSFAVHPLHIARAR